jgi:hypothetical protein
MTKEKYFLSSRSAVIENTPYDDCGAGVEHEHVLAVEGLHLAGKQLRGDICKQQSERRTREKEQGEIKRTRTIQQKKAGDREKQPERSNLKAIAPQTLLRIRSGTAEGHRPPSLQHGRH